MMVAVITVVSMRLQPNRGALHLHKLRGFTLLARSYAC